MKRSDFTFLKRAKVVAPILIVTWVLLFAFVVWPQLSDNGSNAEQIVSLDGEIEALGGWQKGRIGLAGSVKLWEQELNASFERRFPRERSLKELFYDIAAVANRSGVDPIHIRALETWQGRAQNRDAWEMDDIDDTVEAMDLDQLCQELGISPDELPRGELEAHRLSVDFEANFADMTRFIAGLTTLSRAVNVASAQLRPGDRGSIAQLDLEYYVQTGN